jgi:hypothetical protein
VIQAEVERRVAAGRGGESVAVFYRVLPDAAACSKPPKGRARWTLRLLEKKVVELQIVDRASDSTIGRALKKTFSSPIAASAGSFRRKPMARS